MCFTLMLLDTNLTKVSWCFLRIIGGLMFLNMTFPKKKKKAFNKLLTQNKRDLDLCQGAVLCCEDACIQPQRVFFF